MYVRVFFTSLQFEFNLFYFAKDKKKGKTFVRLLLISCKKIFALALKEISKAERVNICEKFFVLLSVILAK